MNYMKIIAENAVKFADKPILADDNIPKGLTYGQVDEISGKVYAYLQSKGIGKEDFVMICLPRGVKPIVSLLGIWKNGSAFVLVEDNYAPERIEFIKQDCNCKLVIDLDVWEEIQNCEAKPGFAQTSPHDAAFAVYTSGTTGNPKGVLHEYGNIDRMLTSIDMQSCDKLATAEDRFALVAPLNFIASLLIILKGFDTAAFLYVVSYKTLKNPLLIGMFLVTNRMTGTFLTPSHIRRMGKKLPGLRFCIIGSEPANEVYMDGLLIHNFYLMSESGFAVTHFLIDKLYAQTPVGNSEFGHKIYLLDENGNEVADGEEGEICFENDFVRGYLNLPEQTAAVFKDKGDGRGRLYYSGDLARKDENGNLVICGRLSDMVKINGNRVEPGEIEEVAKKVLKMDWTAARIFDDGEKVFICLYYKDKISFDEERVRKEMELYLPYYMIPAFFIHIDSIPLRPNGKMDRKALPKPDFNDYKEDYVEPRDEIEKALCDAISKVLKMDKIGIKDDFYQLGGDSLASLDVIVESGLQGLQVTQIFRGHTPEKIAALYKKESADFADVDIEKANQKALEHAQALTSEQVYMFDYQLYTPKSTMYNLYQMLKFDKEVLNMEKLTASVNASIRNHPALLTTFFFDEDGKPMQKYAPESQQDVVLEQISEAELETLKDSLVQPFKMINSPLFRCRVFETEAAGYLFLDVHHTLFDGTSSKVFLSDILSFYFDQPLEPDYYYYNIRKREKATWSDFYLECKDYFDKKYFNNGIQWQKYPKIDNETRENDNDDIFYRLPLETEAYNRALKLNSLTPNAFFVTANILATAFYNQYKNIMVSWIYNGRENMNELSTVGLMFRDLPVAVSLSEKLKITELYADVVEQINQGIEHSCYSAIEQNGTVVDDDIICVLYQDDLREIDDVPGLLGEVELKRNYAASQSVMDIEVLKSEDGLEIMFDYAASRYNLPSIERYRDITGATVKALIACTDNEQATVKSVLADVCTEMNCGGFFKKRKMLKWLKK